MDKGKIMSKTKMLTSRTSAIAKCIMSTVLAVSLSLPIQGLAWAAEGDLDEAQSALNGNTQDSTSDIIAPVKETLPLENFSQEEAERVSSVADSSIDAEASANLDANGDFSDEFDLPIDSKDDLDTNPSSDDADVDISIDDGNEASVIEDMNALGIVKADVSITNPSAGTVLTYESMRFSINDEDPSTVSFNGWAGSLANLPTSNLMIPDQIDVAGKTYIVTAITPSETSILRAAAILSENASEAAIHLARAEAVASEGTALTVTSISVPSTVEMIDSAAFAAFPNARKIEAVSSEFFDSYNGLLYTENLKSLVAVPEGTVGTITLPQSVESINAALFARAFKLASIFVEGADYSGTTWTLGREYHSAAPLLAGLNESSDDITKIPNEAFQTPFISAYGVLYSHGGSMLVAAPAGLGATAVVIAPCMRIGEAAFWGNTDSVMYEAADVEVINGDVASPLATIGVYGNVEDIAATKRIENGLYETLGSFQQTTASVKIALESGRQAWEQAGFTSIEIEEASTEATQITDGDFTYMLQDDMTLAVSWADSTVSPRGGFIDIPSSYEFNGDVLPVTNIAMKGFSGINGLFLVNVPSTVTEIGVAAFENTKTLNTVELPEGLRRIGARAFAGTDLLSIVIPESVSSIGTSAFGDLADAVICDLSNADVASDVLSTSVGIKIYVSLGATGRWKVPPAVSECHVYEAGTVSTGARARVHVGDIVEAEEAGIALTVPEGAACEWSYAASRARVDVDAATIEPLKPGLCTAEAKVVVAVKKAVKSSVEGPARLGDAEGLPTGDFVVTMSTARGEVYALARAAAKMQVVAYASPGMFADGSTVKTATDVAAVVNVDESTGETSYSLEAAYDWQSLIGGDLRSVLYENAAARGFYVMDGAGSDSHYVAINSVATTFKFTKTTIVLCFYWTYKGENKWTFDANGGQFSDGSATLSKNVSESLISTSPDGGSTYHTRLLANGFSATSVMPEKEGFVFAGFRSSVPAWNGQDFFDKDHTFSVDFFPSTDVTFEAVWGDVEMAVSMIASPGTFYDGTTKKEITAVGVSNEDAETGKITYSFLNPFEAKSFYGSVLPKYNSADMKNVMTYCEGGIDYDPANSYNGNEIAYLATTINPEVKFAQPSVTLLAYWDGPAITSTFTVENGAFSDGSTSITKTATMSMIHAAPDGTSPYYTCVAGDEISLADIVPTSSRDDYVFKGFRSNVQTLSGKSLFTDKYLSSYDSFPAADVTFSAEWDGPFPYSVEIKNEKDEVIVSGRANYTVNGNTATFAEGARVSIPADRLLEAKQIFELTSTREGGEAISFGIVSDGFGSYFDFSGAIASSYDSSSQKVTLWAKTETRGYTLRVTGFKNRPYFISMGTHDEISDAWESYTGQTSVDDYSDQVFPNTVSYEVGGGGTSLRITMYNGLYAVISRLLTTDFSVPNLSGFSTRLSETNYELQKTSVYSLSQDTTLRAVYSPGSYTLAAYANGGEIFMYSSNTAGAADGSYQDDYFATWGESTNDSKGVKGAAVGDGRQTMGGTSVFEVSADGTKIRFFCHNRVYGCLTINPGYDAASIKGWKIGQDTDDSELLAPGFYILQSATYLYPVWSTGYTLTITNFSTSRPYFLSTGTEEEISSQWNTFQATEAVTDGADAIFEDVVSYEVGLLGTSIRVKMFGDRRAVLSREWNGNTSVSNIAGYSLYATENNLLGDATYTLTCDQVLYPVYAGYKTSLNLNADGGFIRRAVAWQDKLPVQTVPVFYDKWGEDLTGATVDPATDSGVGAGSVCMYEIAPDGVGIRWIGSNAFYGIGQVAPEYKDMGLKGWSRSQDGLEVVGPGRYANTSSITLYPIWDSGYTLTVTGFDPDTRCYFRSEGSLQTGADDDISDEWDKQVSNNMVEDFSDSVFNRVYQYEICGGGTSIRIWMYGDRYAIISREQAGDLTKRNIAGFSSGSGSDDLLATGIYPVSASQTLKALYNKAATSLTFFGNGGVVDMYLSQVSPNANGSFLDDYFATWGQQNSQKTYTRTANPNGSNSLGSVIAFEVSPDGMAIRGYCDNIVYFSLCVPAGYTEKTLMGWSTSADSSDMLAPGLYICDAGKTNNIYPIWGSSSRMNKVTVHAMDGISFSAIASTSDGRETMFSQSVLESGANVEFGSLVVLKATPKEGYLFNRWLYNDANGDTACLGEQFTFSVTGDMAFFGEGYGSSEGPSAFFLLTVAQSEGIGAITARYVDNNGVTQTVSGDSLAEGAYLPGMCVITLTAEAAAGYGFTGWRDGTMNGPLLTSSKSYQLILLGAKTIAAVCDVADLAITWNYNFAGESFSEEYAYDPDGFLDFPELAAAPDRLGYSIEGWYTSPEGGTKLSDNHPIPTGDTTYYAHWCENRYEFHFLANSDQTIDIEGVSPQVSDYTGTIAMPETGKDAVVFKTGHFYEKWQCAGEQPQAGASGLLTSSFITADNDEFYDGVTPIKINVWPIWNEINYTIEVSYGYDESGEGAPKSGATVVNGVSFKYTDLTETAGKTIDATSVSVGYSFVGWRNAAGENLSSDGNGLTVTISNFSKLFARADNAAAETAKVTASWREHAYKVELLNPEGSASVMLDSDLHLYHSDVTLPSTGDNEAVDKALAGNGYTINDWRVENKSTNEAIFKPGKASIFDLVAQSSEGRRGDHATLQLNLSKSTITYSITYDENDTVTIDGVEVKDPNTTSVAGENDEEYNVEKAIVLASPSREGWIFTGWKVTLEDGATAPGGTGASTQQVNGVSTTTIGAGTYGNLKAVAQWVMAVSIDLPVDAVDMKFYISTGITEDAAMPIKASTDIPAKLSMKVEGAGELAKWLFSPNGVKPVFDEKFDVHVDYVVGDSVRASVPLFKTWGATENGVEIAMRVDEDGNPTDTVINRNEYSDSGDQDKDAVENGTDAALLVKDVIGTKYRTILDGAVRLDFNRSTTPWQNSPSAWRELSSAIQEGEKGEQLVEVGSLFRIVWTVEMVE